MQVDPIKPKLKLPGIKRLKLKCDEPLSNVAFKYNLRCYHEDGLVLRGCEVLVPGIAFLDHVREWRAQRIPAALAAGAYTRQLLSST